MPKVIILAGPNGSGKSTLFQDIKDEYNFPFVNADIIEKQLLLHGQIDLKNFGIENESTASVKSFLTEYLESQKEDSLLAKSSLDIEVKDTIIKASFDNLTYEAALLADFIRRFMANYKLDFIFETVMSHPSKIAFLWELKGLGYEIDAYFISTWTPAINVLRVDVRVADGGHSVPQNKIISRWYRSSKLASRLYEVADNMMVFDNSLNSAKLVFRAVANEHEVFEPNDLWFKTYLAKYIYDNSKH